MPFKGTKALSSDLTSSLTKYIGEHFKEVSPDAFTNDVARLCHQRAQAVEGGVEVHRDWVARLVRYDPLPRFSFSYSWVPFDKS